MYQVRLYDILSGAFIGPVICATKSLSEAAKAARAADIEQAEELFWVPQPKGTIVPSYKNRVDFLRHHYKWEKSA